MSELDLAAIRERSDTYIASREAEASDPGSITAEYVAESASRSADDVPALIAEVERLRRDIAANEDSEDALLAIAEKKAQRLNRVIRLVSELTQDADGNSLDPDKDIPVGEVVRALAGVAL